MTTAAPAPPAKMASAQDYLDHARAINRIAGNALPPETRPVTLDAKISYGLSLQGAELAGKAMLRSLGMTPDQIKKQYPSHNLMALLHGADELLRQQPDADLKTYHHFLLKRTTIDGVEYRYTYGHYLQTHFSNGDAAKSRNYLYPDTGQFMLEHPLRTMYAITEYLIGVAEGVAAVIGP